MPCTKTPSQACGGPDRINLYYLEGATPATPPASVSINPGPHGWVFEGCYSDQVGARTLANQVSTPGGASGMTVALCADACHSSGYQLAGVEYGKLTTFLYHSCLRLKLIILIPQKGLNVHVTTPTPMADHFQARPTVTWPAMATVPSTVAGPER